MGFELIADLSNLLWSLNLIWAIFLGIYIVVCGEEGFKLPTV